jgi:hypothetical protein
MSSFREHGVMLYLDRAEYVGFIKCQADKGLGRSYAGKLCFIEGQYRLGYLSQADYETRVKKYSQGLKVESPNSENFAALAEQRKLESILQGALKEWDHLPKRVQEYHLKTATNHRELSVSARIIEKSGNHGITRRDA